MTSFDHCLLTSLLLSVEAKYITTLTKEPSAAASAKDLGGSILRAEKSQGAAPLLSAFEVCLFDMYSKHSNGNV